jgi:uncharacterized protein (TIGR03437 family)
MNPKFLPLLLLPLAASAQIAFMPAGSVPFGFNTAYAIADFNLDGRQDLVTLSALTQTLRVFYSTPNGSFNASGNTVQVTDATPSLIEPGDFNNDGRPDLAIISGTASTGYIRLYLASGTGTGSFSPGPRIETGIPWGAKVTSADFDRDGNLDLAVSPSNTNVYFYKGNGSGNFSATGFPAAQYPGAIGQLRAADMNNDGRPDLVAAIALSGASTLMVALGDGTGNFGPLSVGFPPSSSSCCQSLRLGDLNGDRAMDAITISSDTGTPTIWMNSGFGALSPQTVFATPAFDTAIADFDLDGKVDFALGITSPQQLIFELNVSTGFFFPSIDSPIPFGSQYPYLEVVDLNGDRKPDFLMNLTNTATGEAGFQAFLNSNVRQAVLREQIITFPTIPNRAISEGTISLGASTTSGLPITYATLSTACSVRRNVVTPLSAGPCGVIALQPGDATWGAAAPVTRSFNVTTVVQQTQIINFGAVADRSLSNSPFNLTANATSGLTVTFASATTSVCTVSGSSVTLVSAGTCTITASQAGNTNYAAAAEVTQSFTVTAAVPLVPRIDAIANAASNIPGTIAPASYAALYGANLLPSPTLTIRDALGIPRPLDITYSSATQINFLLPAGIASGPAGITVANANGTAQLIVTVAPTVPGLFSSDGSGKGLAAANVIIVNPDRTTITRLVTDGVIPVKAGTEIYLVLYGTGIRGHANNGVTARVAGRPADVLYAGAQGAYPGLDQINLRIPLTVGGTGTVEIQLIVDGSPSNTVTATFQ